MSNTKYQPISHFFVDHTSLSEANATNEATDAFGPVKDHEATKYRTTSFVRGTTMPIKVFAICKGRVLILPMTVEDYNGAITISETKVNLGIRNVVLFPERNDKTLAHEVMHGLGLRHTHRDGSGTINDPYQLFIYPNANTLPLSQIAEATDNYMSYAKTFRKTTWRWQWDMIRNNIK